jgi:uncharacterized membrane protein YsdA (DUF1294 family)
MAKQPAEWRIEHQLKRRDFRWLRKKSNLVILAMMLFVGITLVVYLFLLPFLPFAFLELTLIKVFIGMNIASLILMGVDKTIASYENVVRIPEFFFFLISFIGGAYGVLIGMYFFHHKLRKMKFSLITMAGVFLTTIALFLLVY